MSKTVNVKPRRPKVLRRSIEAPDQESIPLHCEESEMAVLNAMLIDPSVIDPVFGILQPSDFYFTKNRLVFEAIKQLRQSGVEEIDVVLTADQLTADSRLEEVGGFNRLSALVEHVGHSAHWRHYSEKVRQWSKRRELRHLLSNASTLIAGTGAPVDEPISELIERLTALRDDRTSSRLPDFGFIDSTIFAERRYESKWLVDFVLTANEPCVVAGPSKTLKTTILTELAVSLASGKDFLNKYRVQKQRVAFVSAESGERTLQETAVRVCQSKDIKFGSLRDQLFWAFRPPQITESGHIQSLRDFITRNQITVLILDPAYLCMNLGDGATNQFTVGNILQNLTHLQADTGVTPILAAHTNKNIQTGVELELSNIAYAGFDQWLRQYLLINRRVPYSRSNPGTHKLFVSFGGSAGHAGSIALDIEEGDVRSGRRWEYTVQSAADAQMAQEDELRQAKEKRKRDQQQAKYEERRSAVLAVMRQHPNGETMSNIRNQAGLSGTTFPLIWNDLLSSQTIGVCCESERKNGHKSPLFRIINEGGNRMDSFF